MIINYKNGDSWSNLVLDAIYPVGSIYMSTNSISPATMFGGTWTRIEGQFLLAATDNGSAGAAQAAGNTGGEATHLLTGAESGTSAHGHGFTQPTVNGGGGTDNITGGYHWHEIKMFQGNGANSG